MHQNQKNILVLGILYATIILASIVSTAVLNADWLSLIYTVLILAGVYLNSLKKKEGLAVFSLASAFYSFLNFENKFYGEFALYILITVYYLVFYFRWKKQPQDGLIRTLKPIFYPAWLVFGAIFVPVYMMFLNYIGTSQPLINSLLTLLTCTAVATTASRMWQQYIAWIAINITQIILWATTISFNNLSYLPIIIASVFLFFINIFNLFVWFNAFRKQNCGQGREQRCK